MADWSDRLEFTLTVEFGAGRASIVHAEILPESCHDHAALQLANVRRRGRLVLPAVRRGGGAPTVAACSATTPRADGRVRAAADRRGSLFGDAATTADDDDDDDAREWLLPHAERRRAAPPARACATRTTRASRAGCHAT